VSEAEEEDLNKALLYAILGENEAESIDLIMRGANVDVTFPDGCSPLIKSCNYGYEAIVLCLIEHGVFLNKQSNNGNTGLVVSSTNTYNHRYIPTITNCCTFFWILFAGQMKAAEKNFPRIAEALLNAGADANIHNNEGCCPLIRSSKMGHEEIVRLLVDHNGPNRANINEKSANG
jgi:ankyrin repeat protein